MGDGADGVLDVLNVLVCERLALGGESAEQRKVAGRGRGAVRPASGKPKVDARRHVAGSPGVLLDGFRDLCFAAGTFRHRAHPAGDRVASAAGIAAPRPPRAKGAAPQQRPSGPGLPVLAPGPRAGPDREAAAVPSTPWNGPVDLADALLRVEPERQAVRSGNRQRSGIRQAVHFGLRAVHV